MIFFQGLVFGMTLAFAVGPIALLIVDHAADLQMKTVGAEIDRGQGFVKHGLGKFRQGTVPLYIPGFGKRQVLKLKTG